MNLLVLLAIVFSSFTFGFVMRGFSVQKRIESLQEDIAKLREIVNVATVFTDRSEIYDKTNYMCHHIFEHRVLQGWKPTKSWIEVTCKNDPFCPNKDLIS